MLFWNAADLERKLGEFSTYFNQERTHSGLQGDTPASQADNVAADVVSLDNYRWQRHCKGLFELPVAA